ncbi:MAG: beta-N-acetylhexosaminidase [Chloroflexi bacterium]|nr:beta-N-acetylhexosaminidase [Chloroflexota bacterium]
MQSKLWSSLLVTTFLCQFALTSCLEAPMNKPLPTLDTVIPRPVSVTTAGGQFTLNPNASIYVEPGGPELAAIGQYLADQLKPATGYRLPVLSLAGAPAKGGIYLTTKDGDPNLGEEGYFLTITPDLVTLAAYQPAGLFHGFQTIRQLLPASIEQPAPQPGPWVIATGTIRDYPRFAWRGSMLDVARHFFSVVDVKRFIDRLAYYKLNRFHLHLADDQGWRLMINSWPNLARIGGSTAVNHDPGGYFTQAEYSDIVSYAANRYMMIIPEIDTPGHTNAALASYPELNCNGTAPDLYTGTAVGFSSLCVDQEVTYKFLDDVIGEIASLTPGPYIHIGGDEAAATQPADYKKFIERVQTIVQAHGKQMVGWEEISNVDLLPTSIDQYWTNPQQAVKAAQQGVKVLFSPASKTYLDMKYDPSTPLGQDWAGLIEVQDAYDWDPTTQTSGVPENDILGVEAPLWSETLRTIQDVEFMAFPRLIGIAEIGWSPLAGKSWKDFSTRLGAQAPRLDAMQVNFYRSKQVPWK